MDTLHCSKFFRWTFVIVNFVGLLVFVLFSLNVKMPLSSWKTFVVDIRRDTTTTTTVSLPFCENDIHRNAGPINVSTDVPDWKQLEERFNMLNLGGSYTPNCRAIIKTAIIIPYRDREEHLKLFLQHMHPYLQHQNLEYTIYVIEQDHNSLFNRGLLMNVGYIEALKQDNDTKCFIFHDIDMLPMHSDINYTCESDQIIHTAVHVKQFQYRLPYEDYIGGIVLFDKSSFDKVNGFSNQYKGWGGEDDDMFFRINKMNLSIKRRTTEEQRYMSWDHSRDLSMQPRNVKILNIAMRSKPPITEGFRTSSHLYRLFKVERRRLFTWISINVTEH